MSELTPLRQAEATTAKEEALPVRGSLAKPKTPRHHLVEQIETFTADDIINIQELEIERISFDNEDQKREARQAILKLFKGTRSLHTLSLELPDFQTVLPIATICRAGSTLKKFQVTDQSRKGSDPISFDDLQELHDYCPLLEDMEIDLPSFPHKDLEGFADRLTFKAEESLKLLATFNNLTKLSLFCEQSLGNQDPIDSESTDRDCDDAERIMRDLHKNKVGKPFENLSITLDRSYRPKNWRKAPGGEPGSLETKYHWSVRRVFHSKMNDDGGYEQWVSVGSDRVGEAPEETEEERLQADEEWHEYQHSWGGYLEAVRRPRPLISAGMTVTLYLDTSKQNIVKEEVENEEAQKLDAKD